MSRDDGQPYKWPTPEERQAACARFCEHIEQGYSIDSWPDADADTVKIYIEKFPEDFDSELIETAKRECLKFWEGIGIRGTNGEISFFNAGSWIFNMKNRAGWTDKVDHDHGGKVEIVRIIDDVPRK